MRPSALRPSNDVTREGSVSCLFGDSLSGVLERAEPPQAGRSSVTYVSLSALQYDATVLDVASAPLTSAYRLTSDVIVFIDASVDAFLAKERRMLRTSIGSRFTPSDSDIPPLQIASTYSSAVAGPLYPSITARGQPPLVEISAISLRVCSVFPYSSGRPLNNPPRDTFPLDSLDSNMLIVLIVMNPNLPDPVWIRPSLVGTDDPVSMNCPGMPLSSTSYLTASHSGGCSCHSSNSIGGSPLIIDLGSILAVLKMSGSRGSDRNVWLLEKCSPVAVLPQAFGPSIDIAPIIDNLDSIAPSTIRGQYSATMIVAWFCRYILLPTKLVINFQ